MSIIGGIGLTLASPARAQEPQLDLAPATEWTLDYADQHCALRRSFGDESQRIILEIRQNYPGQSLDLTIASVSLQTAIDSPVYAFLPEAATTELMSVNALLQGDRTIGAKFAATLIPEDALRSAGDDGASVRVDDWGQYHWDVAQRDARERQVIGLFIRGVFAQPVTLRTGEMYGPMAALRSCVDDLVRGLGVDPAVQASLSREPKPNSFVRLFQNLSHANAFTPAVQGESVYIRLVIDSSGAVTGCYLPDWEAMVERHNEICTAARRTRFEPALDITGNPVASVVGTVLTRIAGQTVNIR